jgi:rare lipoprotein A (peptidoglycan hydrolase)
VDHKVGGVLSPYVWRRLSVAVLAAGGLLIFFIAVTEGAREYEAIRGVSDVRHSEVGAVPREPDRAGRTMQASYYGRELEGRPMASGEPFDADALTASHKSLPFGTRLEVAYAGESVRVTIKDRGPYVAGRDLDLSLAAAREIGLTGPGEAPVRVTRP